MLRPARAVLVSVAIALAVVGGLGLLGAGPLNPPAGPVASSYKTLAEVEPRTAVNAVNTPGSADSLFRITQRGSYYLTGNITGVVGKHGIEIAASGVTLDLNGFDLVGVGGMGDFSGVRTGVANTTNVAIINGSIRNWGGHGVDFSLVNWRNGRVENVRASGNANSGISVGTGCTVSGCSAHLNGGFSGIFVGNGGTASACAANENAGHGISVSNGGVVSNCSASNNAGYGLYALQGVSITNCSAYQNGSFGINGLQACTITGCSTFANADHGIGAGENGTVSNCTASSNSNSGISVGAGCTVADCNAYQNNVNGIRCISGSEIRRNNCTANGVGNGAGIRVVGGDNRIEGNRCAGADRGIEVNVADNFIVRNVCSGNTTNWVIAAGNAFGPIVNATTNGALISTNGPVAGTLGNTDPNANFNH